MSLLIDLKVIQLMCYIQVLHKAEYIQVIQLMDYMQVIHEEGQI